jgi:dihydroorotate dehydrogenase
MPHIYAALRPLLFALPPEAAHFITLWILRQPATAAFLRKLHNKVAPTCITSAALPGLTLRNPIGLAAGADKNAVALSGWDALGFGFVEVGTVTPLPQPGNPRPRVWRFPRQRALINALGFPNDGAEAVAARLRARREKHPRGGGMLIGVNCGKQKETSLDNAVGDYIRVIEKCGPYADFIVVNVSSPNTAGLRSLQSADTIYPLVREVVQACAAGANTGERSLPVWVKISPDMDHHALLETADAVLRAGAAAIVATNTTLDHSVLGGMTQKRKLPGGLSGAPLFERSLRCVTALHTRFGARLPIVACGGISGPRQVRAFIDAGASLLELYTALIYRGPAVVWELLPD